MKDSDGSVSVILEAKRFRSWIVAWAPTLIKTCLPENSLTVKSMSPRGHIKMLTSSSVVAEIGQRPWKQVQVLQ